MLRRIEVTFILLWLFLVSADSSAEQPNFVVILTDDQGYSDLGCFGGTHVKTPRIDQMAAEGAKLTNFYVAGSICTPSRAALMTGCYPRRISLASGVFLASDENGLHPDEVTIAEVLKSAGYKTGIFGKWHLGDQPEFLPTRQGFDEFFGLPYSHDIHPFHLHDKKHQFPPLPLLEMEKVIEEEPDANFLTKRFTERAVQFIEQHKDSPFFLYIPHPIPHRPIHMSPPFMEAVPEEVTEKLADEDRVDYLTRDRMYNQAISEIDWSVGQILDALKANKIDKNTMVLFTSDNGPKLGKAKPLTGGKGSYFEGGMRVPTVVRWPSKIRATGENNEIMTAMDLLPTFATLAGAELPVDRKIDGQDISAVLTDQKKSPHEAFLYYHKNQLKAVRAGKWKLHFGKGKSLKAALLFNLEEDISEKKNVINQHPEVVANLTAIGKQMESDIVGSIRPAGFKKDAQPLTIRVRE